MSGAPIRRIARRLAAENTRWRVHFDHIADAAGREVADYLVVEPKVRLAGGVSGVAVLAMAAEHIVLLPVWRHAIEAAGYELVKGFIDAGESAEAAALRELREETGLACAPADLVFLGHVAPEPSTLAGKGALYLARNCEPCGGRLEDEAGLGRPVALTAAAVRRKMQAGEIQDALTIIGCLRALAETGRGRGQSPV